MARNLALSTIEKRAVDYVRSSSTPAEGFPGAKVVDGLRGDHRAGHQPRGGIAVGDCGAERSAAAATPGPHLSDYAHVCAGRLPTVAEFTDWVTRGVHCAGFGHPDVAGLAVAELRPTRSAGACAGRCASTQCP
ncbi:hypothetical protein [Saccharopolyspora hattusasensis]|uniref:hypothetical protein n=1 Tax=Saccharopolyspora hattusasensis TaxID=1128679 RepID=UPI003D9643D1